MNPELLQQRMADIIVPVPAGPTLQDAGILILLVVLLSWAAWRIRRGRRQPRQTQATATGWDDALQQLELVRQDWQGGQINHREAAFRLATVLRLGLHLAQLPSQPPAAVMDKTQWHNTMATLNALRYPSQLSQPLTDECFIGVRQILLQAGKGS